MSTALFAFAPDAAFRGARRYVHSTDIYTRILEGAAQAGIPVDGKIDLKFHARIERTPEYAFFTIDVADIGGAARCAFESAGKTYIARVVPGDRPVGGRRDYDESPVARFSEVRDGCARLAGPTGLEPIEALTALAVHLHKTTCPAPSGGRWMLGHLLLRRPLIAADANGLMLKFERFLGKTITRTGITAAAGPLGSMIFTCLTDRSGGGILGAS